MKIQPSDNIRAFTGLRAIACTVVILAHCSSYGLGQVMTFGQAGPTVSLIFVLSGYLLMRSGLLQIQPSIDAVPQRYLGLKLISFLIRRIMRVYPAYVVALVIYKIMVWHIHICKYSDGLLKYYEPSIWSSLYFSIHGMMFHLWTLRIEMLFYLTVLPPCLVIAGELIVLDHKYFRHSRYQSIYLFYLITTILMSYIQYSNGNARGGMPDGRNFFVHLPAFWHGCLGGIASYHFNLSKIKIPTDTRSRWIVALATWGIILRLLVGNAGMIQVHTNWDPNSWWHNPFLQTPFKAILLFVLEFTHETNSISRTLSLPLFQYLGKISYSTYLMHMFVFILYKMNTTIRGLEGTLEVVILSYILGAILYHVVETRGVKYGENFIKLLRLPSKIYGEILRTWLPSSKTFSHEAVHSEIELKTA